MGNTLTQKEFEDKVKLNYDSTIEVVGRYKNSKTKVLVKDKYGLMHVKGEYLCNGTKTPGIASALNRTEYFMSTLKEVQRDIYDMLKPLSEYTNNQSKMLFDTKYGVVSVQPNNLISGRVPSLRTALDRKSYRTMQFKEIHGDLYSYKFPNGTASGAHIEVECKTHGTFLQEVDNHLQGKGCPKCRNRSESTILYFIRLYNDEESFYKIGVSHRRLNTSIARFSRYKTIGYDVEEICIKEFETEDDSVKIETMIKREFKSYRYTPKNWEFKKSIECFDFDIASKIVSIINGD